jgi:ubiquinone/menaquinone biosynthesis C-methylase UbiE
MTSKVALPRDLAPILPGITYNEGFLSEGKTLPYFSFCQPDEKAHWSNDMTEFIAEASKTHFIDLYNRTVALDGVAPALSKPGSTYIDLGCSSGYMLEDTANAFPQASIFGSDYFGSGLAQCHKQLPDIPLLQMDVTNCPLPSNAFDAITCLNVLEHIPDDTKALQELYRLLRPSGRLVITVPMNQKLYDIMDEVHFHCRRYSWDDLESKVLKSGYKVLKMNYFGVMIYPPFYIQKRLNQIRFRGKSFEQKHQIALNQTRSTGRMRWMEKLCYWEKQLGQKMRYPFGIRTYLVATK